MQAIYAFKLGRSLERTLCRLTAKYAFLTKRNVQLSLKKHYAAEIS